MNVEEKNIKVGDDLINNYVRALLSANTKKAYTRSFQIFLKWCDKEHLSALPADPHTLALFLADQASRQVAVSSLQVHLAAIKLAHDVKGLVTPTDNKLVLNVLRGIKRSSERRVVKKAPATVERIEAMIRNCKINSLSGLRNKALLLLGFAGAFRRSELIALTVSDLTRTPDGVKVLIRKSKTDQEKCGEEIAILNGNKLRVVDHLYRWLNDANIHDGFIFRRLIGDNVLTNDALTPRSVANIVKSHAGRAGFTISNFSGHSLRAGFLTSAAANGASIVKMMEISRHRNMETLIGYIRSENLFDQHAGKDFL